MVWVFEEGPQILYQSDKYFRDHPPILHGQKSGHPQDAGRHFWGLQNRVFEGCKGTGQCSKFPTLCMMYCIKNSKDTCHKLTLPQVIEGPSVYQGGKARRQQYPAAVPQSLSLLPLDSKSLQQHLQQESLFPSQTYVNNRHGMDLYHYQSCQTKVALTQQLPKS